MFAFSYHQMLEDKLEEYLGRPNIPKSRAEFESLLAPLFTTIKVDDSCVMLKYFVTAKK